MKSPKEMTLIGLVLRLVVLKLQAQILAARRKALRGELMSRLPKNAAQVIAGYTFPDGRTQLSPRALAASELPGKPLSKQLLDNPAEQQVIRQITECSVSTKGTRK
jgi:hypothetical protein